MRFILASASPRRRELMSRVCADFSVVPAKGAELMDTSLPPEQIAQNLAMAKCAEVYSQNKECLVVGCDTIVVFGGRILGKPKDEKDAEETLSALSGKTHSAITGVCVRSPKGERISFEKTQVTFNSLTQKFIKDYVKGGSPMDKAGSYGIQDEGVVKSYAGDYYNVVGFPVALVERLIKELV